MSSQNTLGSTIRRLRFERNWTLADMSAAVGIPISTLGRIERDLASLTYDKLLQLSERLNIGLLELFSMPAVAAQGPVANARRSIAAETNTINVTSRNYIDKYLCSELTSKIITPILVDVKASSIAEFGPLITHDGEEFIYVIRGSIVVYTSFYEPTQLQVGGGHYLDSQMGHAYVRAPGCDAATILVVCASKAEGHNQALIQQMIGLAEGADRSASPAGKSADKAAEKKTTRPRAPAGTGRTRARATRR